MRLVDSRKSSDGTSGCGRSISFLELTSFGSIVDLCHVPLFPNVSHANETWTLYPAPLHLGGKCASHWSRAPTARGRNEYT